MPFKDCIKFKGRIGKDGYGWAYSRFAKKTRNAHRVAWENAYGKIDEGLVVMHKCDNRSCVNLDHLQLGTPSDNMQDMHNKGRWCDRKGAKHPRTKITDEVVQAIKDLYLIDGFAQADLAEVFDFNQSNISRLINGKRWTHLNKYSAL